MVSEKGQILNYGLNSCFHFVLYSEVRLYILKGDLHAAWTTNILEALNLCLDVVVWFICMCKLP